MRTRTPSESPIKCADLRSLPLEDLFSRTCSACLSTAPLKPRVPCEFSRFYPSSSPARRPRTARAPSTPFSDVSEKDALDRAPSPQRTSPKQKNGTKKMDDTLNPMPLPRNSVIDATRGRAMNDPPEDLSAQNHPRIQKKLCAEILGPYVRGAAVAEHVEVDVLAADFHREGRDPDAAQHAAPLRASADQRPRRALS